MTVIVHDDLDVVMIQGTIYKRRQDYIPYLRIHGHHTYHRTMDDGEHGMATMIKHTIPSEEAEQIHVGGGTVTLIKPDMAQRKPLLRNVYRVDGELDITTQLTNNNNICLKSNIQTSSVDCAPRELTHACSRSETCSRSDTEACDMCYVF